jgi:hypothetical protein
MEVILHLQAESPDHLIAGSQTQNSTLRSVLEPSYTRNAPDIIPEQEQHWDILPTAVFAH